MVQPAGFVLPNVLVQMTPLMDAVKRGQLLCVKALTAAGANVNFQDKVWLVTLFSVTPDARQNGSTALIMAAYRNQKLEVEHLVSAGADTAAKGRMEVVVDTTSVIMLTNEQAATGNNTARTAGEWAWLRKATDALDALHSAQAKLLDSMDLEPEAAEIGSTALPGAIVFAQSSRGWWYPAVLSRVSRSLAKGRFARAHIPCGFLAGHVSAIPCVCSQRAVRRVVARCPYSGSGSCASFEDAAELGDQV